jgi:hypothetical protein
MGLQPVKTFIKIDKGNKSVQGEKRTWQEKKNHAAKNYF